MVKGADYIPKEYLDEAWRSATHGKNEFVWVDRVNNARAIGYVTKYLTKELTRTEKGVKEEHREAIVLKVDEDGKKVETVQTYAVEVVSQARRIRYSRHFFPMSTEELRFQLFSKLEDPDQLAKDEVVVPAEDAELPAEVDAVKEHDEWIENILETDVPKKRAVWSLYEAEPFTSDWKEYRSRRRRALLESLMIVRDGQWRISGRILSVWSFQRSQRKESQKYAAA